MIVVRLDAIHALALPAHRRLAASSYSEAEPSPFGPRAGCGYLWGMALVLQIGLAWLALSGLVAFFVYCCSVVSHRGQPDDADAPERPLGAVEGRREPVGAIPAAPPRGGERRGVRRHLHPFHSRLSR